MLKKIYENINKLRKVRSKYWSFKPNFKKKFVSFYNKLICNNRLLKYFNRILINDLIFKLNKNFRSILINNFRNFDLII